MLCFAMYGDRRLQTLDFLVVTARLVICNGQPCLGIVFQSKSCRTASDSLRLLRVLDGFFMLAQGSVGAAHRVKRPNFEIAIPKLTPQDKGLRQDLIRLLCGAALTRFQGSIF